MISASLVHETQIKDDEVRNTASLSALIDPVNVNARRASVGLEPIETHLKSFGNCGPEMGTAVRISSSRDSRKLRTAHLPSVVVQHAGVMRRTLLLALGLGLLMPRGQAQRIPTSRIALELQQLEPVLAGQPVKLQLKIAHQGSGETVIGGLRGDTVPCPLFKVYDKAGGPPLIERYVTSDCDTGENVTFRAGQRRVYSVTLPMKLTPGQYTAILTLRSQPPLFVRTTVNVRPGPFVAELVLPNGARAGQPLDLRVAFRNVWRSASSQDLRLCGKRLLIRDDWGKTVYDSKPEGMACTADLRPTRVAAGGIYTAPWGTLPALKAGAYTAILWGLWSEAVLPFNVEP